MFQLDSSAGSWRRHMDLAEGTTDFGLSQAAWKDYRVADRRGPDRPAFSMLELGELALLYALTRDHWTGAGEVLDLGPYAGLTTWCLARGMRANREVSQRAKRKRLHSFDLFLADDESGRSLFPGFSELNVLNGAYMQIYPGDITRLHWTGGPAEIIFLDLAKSVELQDHVISEFLNQLLVDGILVQQDYVHYFHWWIHLFMEIFSSHFERVELVYGATAVFRLIKPLPELRGWTLQAAASLDEQVTLHRRHVERAPRAVQAVLWCAHAKLLLDIGRTAEAREALTRVELVSDPDGLHDFRAVVPANVDAIEQLLARP